MTFVGVGVGENVLTFCHTLESFVSFYHTIITFLESLP